MDRRFNIEEGGYTALIIKIITEIFDDEKTQNLIND